MQLVNFEIPDCPQESVQALQRELGVSDATAQVLVRRGLADPGDAAAFLRAGDAQDRGHDPSAFSGIERAVETILRNVREGARITVHGDYDVDGVCATAVLVRALQALGAEVDWYLPERAGDGYGLRDSTVQSLLARGTRLLITVDCGVSSVEEVAGARALGMEVVISDHHSPRADGVLPDAPIVHPQLCGYPCPDLCATAVAYKLAVALMSARGDAPESGSLACYVPQHDLDLVALATIADVVPLVGENRALVRRGLRTLASTSKPGLRALMSVANLEPSQLDERAVAFGLAPRINAAGRLYRADAALELVLTGDSQRARRLAQELDRANQERRETERQILWQAEAQVKELGPQSAYVLAGEGWHPGVIGIVASRLVEQLHRPVVMIALDGESGRGSARSIERFDLLGGLTACAGHLARHGGHRAAAGLEIERDKLADFTAAFTEHARQALGAEDLLAVERVDAVVSAGQLDMALAEELARLAPFGRGNPAISLLVRGAVFKDVRPMGEGRHARFTVISGDAHAKAVAFGTGSKLPVEEGVDVEATFKLEVNEWNGVSEPRLVLRNIGAPQPAAGAPLEPQLTVARVSDVMPAAREAQPELALF